MGVLCPRSFQGPYKRRFQGAGGWEHWGELGDTVGLRGLLHGDGVDDNSIVNLEHQIYFRFVDCRKIN